MRGSVLALALIAWIAAGIYVAPVLGHAILVRSDPPQNAVLQQPPKAAVLFFSEELEPQFSAVEIYDREGNRIGLGNLTISNREMTVGLPELKPGIYTVAWRALSRVDGHITRGAYPFAIGAVAASELSRAKAPDQASAAIPVWEVLARWANYLAQTVFVGGVIFIAFVWAHASRRTGYQNLEHGIAPLVKTVRIATILCLASTLSLLFLQVVAVAGIDQAVFKVLTTRLGIVQLSRIGILICSILLLWRIRPSGGIHGITSRKNIILMLLLGTGLLLTTSLTSHGAAVEWLPSVAVLMDLFHLVAVAAWVGGLVHFVLFLRWASRNLDELVRAKITANLIRRFSALAILSIGVLGITGAYNMSLQLYDVSNLVSTEYGQTLLTKLILIFPLVALGAFNEVSIYKRFVAAISRSIQNFQSPERTRRTFRISLGIESSIGLVILLVVGVLTSLAPASSNPASIGAAIVIPASPPPVLNTYSEGVYIDLKISPLQVGYNDFRLSLTDVDGKPVRGIKSVALTFKFLDSKIGEVSAPPEKSGGGEYILGGNYLSLPGTWQVEVHATREAAYDAIASFKVRVATTPLMLKFVELPIPGQNSEPYGLAVDKKGRIWFTESFSGRIVRFDPRIGNVEGYSLPGSGSRPTLLTTDPDENVWITDPQYNRILRFDTRSVTFHEYPIPTPDSIPLAITSDSNGNIWFVEQLGGKISRFTPSNSKFTEFALPTPDSGPLGIATDPDGNVWFTEFKGNKIGKLQAATGRIEELRPKDFALNAPAAIVIAPDGSVWFTEHGADRLTRFKPSNMTFEAYTLPARLAGPYGLALDLRGNLWFAEHLGNKIGMFNVKEKTFDEYVVPTSNSEVQWVAADAAGNVWFTEPKTDKLGLIGNSPEASINYAHDKERNTYLQLLLYAAVIIAFITAIAYALSRKRFRRLELELPSSGG